MANPLVTLSVLSFLVAISSGCSTATTTINTNTNTNGIGLIDNARDILDSLKDSHLNNMYTDHVYSIDIHVTNDNARVTIKLTCNGNDMVKIFTIQKNAFVDDGTWQVKSTRSIISMTTEPHEIIGTFTGSGPIAEE